MPDWGIAQSDSHQERGGFIQGRSIASALYARSESVYCCHRRLRIDCNDSTVQFKIEVVSSSSQALNEDLCWIRGSVGQKRPKTCHKELRSPHTSIRIVPSVSASFTCTPRLAFDGRTSGRPVNPKPSNLQLQTY